MATKVYYIDGELRPNINVQTVKNYIFNNLHATYAIAEVVDKDGYLGMGGGPFLLCAIHSYCMRDARELEAMKLIFQSFTAHGIDRLAGELKTIEWDAATGTFIEENSEIRSPE